MNKTIFPLLVGATLLGVAPAHAQTVGYRDPFNTLFDTMMFSPKYFSMAEFSGPKMDVADLKDKIEVKAELPGMDEKDVVLTIEDGILTLSGERKSELQEEGKDYYVKEISSGAFSRSIRLPKNIDQTKTEAVFKKGILTITIPKIELKEENVKKIPIKSDD